MNHRCTRLFTALAAALLIHTGTGCTQTEVRNDPNRNTRLRFLAEGPGVESTVNRMPDPVRPDPNLAKPIPLAPPQPPPTPGAQSDDPAKQAAAEAAQLLHPPKIYGQLICKALDPVSRRPLAVRIRAVAENKTYDFHTDSQSGVAQLDLPVGRVSLFCAAGEFYTPYSNRIDVQPGVNTVEVLLTQVPELTPARYGLFSLTLARTARRDFAAAAIRCADGQPDRYAVLGAPDNRGGFHLIDGPAAAAGCRFGGLGVAALPPLASGPQAIAADPRLADRGLAWDDLHRLQQAGDLRLWLYPGGRPTDPELVRLLGLPARQYVGPEAWLAAERGPGLELVTLGPRGEGEAEYFTLLNRGQPVSAVAEPLDADPPPPPPRAAAAAGLLDETDTLSYQSLPPDLYASALTPRTLIRVGRFNAVAAQPAPGDILQWLAAGGAQVCYGPVLSWKIREFTDVVGYPAQPIPAAERLYHLDLTAFVGPGTPPEFRSIQLIELLRNGEVVARLPIDRPLQSVRDLTFEIRESARCWYMLRAYSGPAADNRPDSRTPKPEWRRSWSAPIFFAAIGDVETPVYERRTLPVAIRAFRAVDNSPVDALALVVRGGKLIQKVALPAGSGQVEARVGDHILVGGPGWQYRETILSADENRTGDPWRAIDARFAAPVAADPDLHSADRPPESASAANARLSGLGLICPLYPRQPEPKGNVIGPIPADPTTAIPQPQ